MIELPNDNAVLAHVADSEAGTAICRGLRKRGFNADQLEIGNGEELASALGRTDDPDSDDSLLPAWLLSLGQDREIEVEIAQRIREGRHAVVVRGVEVESARDDVVAILKENGAQGITVLGKWQNESVL